MGIKDSVLMICDLLSIKINSKSLSDYEKAKRILAKRILSMRFSGSEYEQSLKALADYIGV